MIPSGGNFAGIAFSKLGLKMRWQKGGGAKQEAVARALLSKMTSNLIIVYFVNKPNSLHMACRRKQVPAQSRVEERGHRFPEAHRALVLHREALLCNAKRALSMIIASVGVWCGAWAFAGIGVYGVEGDWRKASGMWLPVRKQAAGRH